MTKIFIVSGEQSGDNIGALVIEKLKKITNGNIVIKGVGGNKMIKKGLESIFPMEDISLIGFTEIIPHIVKIYYRINQAYEYIKKFKPDYIITIDSPGFSMRLIKKVKNAHINAKLVHIVAPSVWAYKPERAKEFASFYDLMLTLLPFEPEYFIKEGLDAKYVGHFVFENKFCMDKNLFRIKHNISTNDIVLAITPGSREGEIKRHLSVFLDSAKLLSEKIENDKKIYVCIACSSKLTQNLIEKNILKYKDLNIILVCDNIFELYKSADIALAKSGTNTIEIAEHSIPLIVGYKLNFFTWYFLNKMIKVKYASLINIIANREIIPEFIQNNCTANKLSEKLHELIVNKDLSNKQILETRKILDKMRFSDKSPSLLSAEYILGLEK